MAQATWPVGADLQRFLTAAGIISQQPTAIEQLLDLDAAALAAKNQFERRTGIVPFLAALNQTRLIDPPGPAQQVSFFGMRGGARDMSLSPGLLDVTNQPVVTVNTVAFTRGTQYYLYPSDAPQRNQPFTRLEFLIPVYGQPQTVSITGDWGYSYTVPDNLYRGVLSGAALNIGAELAGYITNGVVRWSQSTMTMDYGQKPLDFLFSRWEKRFNDAVNLYRQQVFV